MTNYKNRIKGFDYKYIIREVLLIFIGINLAIWFNSWNTSKLNNKNKDIAITRIKGELISNMNDLKEANTENSELHKALKEYLKLVNNKGSIEREKFLSLQERFPKYYHVSEKYVGENKIQNKHNFNIDFTEPNLAKVAWITTLSTNVPNSFSFDCLYELEMVYDTQKSIEEEISKAYVAIQKDELKELESILNILNQFCQELLKDYEVILERVESCR